MPNYIVYESIRKVAVQLDVGLSLLGKTERNERQSSKEKIKKHAKIFVQDESYFLSKYIIDQIACNVLEEESDLSTLKASDKIVHYINT